MDKIILEPLRKQDDIIVQFTNTYVIDKKLYITVPSSYKAIIFIDEEPISRIDECNNQSVFKKLNKDKSFLKKKIKVAFIKINSIPQIEWGFGDIKVNNGEETYLLGSSGQIEVSIEDRIKFIKTLGTNKNITSADIKDKIISYVKNVGKALFGEYFNDNGISSDDADRHLTSLRERLIKALENESKFKDLGLKIDNLNISTLLTHDSEKIKQATPEVSLDEFNSYKKEMNRKLDDISTKLINQTDLDLIKDEILNEVEALTKDSITKDDLDSLRNDIEEKIENIDLDAEDTSNIDEIYNLIKKLEEKFNITLNTKINDIKQIYENIIDEKEQNKLELYEKAKEDYINDLKLTTDLLIDKAETNEDLAAPAGVIYSNVELNLTKHPDLNHIGNIFTTSQDNYYKVAKEIMTTNMNLLNAFTKRVYEVKDGIEYIEVPTEFRFIIYGLSVEDAFQAAKDWTLLNKCRHLSIENKEKLERALKDRNITRKEFLKYILEFYRKTKLFTKD